LYYGQRWAKSAIFVIRSKIRSEDQDQIAFSAQTKEGYGGWL